MPLCARETLAELWHAHGLRDVDEQPLTIDMAFSSFDDYWQPFCRGQGPAGVYVASLAESDRQALQSRLRDWLVNDAPDVGFTLRGRAWAVRGVVI